MNYQVLLTTLNPRFFLNLGEVGLCQYVSCKSKIIVQEYVGRTGIICIMKHIVIDITIQYTKTCTIIIYKFNCDKCTHTVMKALYIQNC